VLCTGILFLQRGVKAAAAGILKRPATILATAFFDNLAWFGYAYATSVSPISLTVMISESYIVLAALLGYIYGHEKLKSHQKIGALIALPSTVLLAYLA
jgi:drug/metabolite transporter (DMT)-like permease